MQTDMGKTLKLTALVVEDDAMQRSLVSLLLEESDMDVVQCESAEAALAVIDRIGYELALIFTDVELAGDMDGVELAYIAKQKLPHLDVVVTSGAPRVRRLPDGTTFMAKPWVPLDVLRAAEHAKHH